MAAYDDTFLDAAGNASCGCGALFFVCAVVWWCSCAVVQLCRVAFFAFFFLIFSGSFLFFSHAETRLSCCRRMQKNAWCVVTTSTVNTQFSFIRPSSLTQGWTRRPLVWPGRPSCWIGEKWRGKRGSFFCLCRVCDSPLIGKLDGPSELPMLGW